MASKPYSPMQSPADIAAKYGDKAKIGQAVQQGIVDPTVGMLAGMVIDRIRAPQPQGPQSTVAQKVMGLGATPQIQQMGMQPPAQPPAQTRLAASGGLMDLPVDDDMFDYAGGGVVAFSNGSPGTFSFDMPMDTGTVDKKTLRAYYLSRGMPLPPALMTDEEKARSSKEPYPAGVFPKMGRFFSDVGTSIGNFVSPGGVGFYSDPTKPGGREMDIGFGPGQFTPPTQQGTAGASSEQVNRLIGAAPIAAPAPAPKVETKPAEAPAAPAAFKLPTPESPVEYKERMKAFGINDDWVKKAEASIEKLGGSAEDKERAIAMAFIRAGLGAAAGTSPNALLNVAQGALGGVEQYAKDTKDIRTAQRDAEKMRIEVAKAQDAQARNDFKAYNDHINKANDIAINLQKLDYEARRLGFEERRTISGEKQAAAYTEAARRAPGEVQLVERFMSDPKFAAAYKNIISARGEPKSRQQALKDWSDDPRLRRQYRTFDEYYATEVMGGAGGLPGVTFMGVRPAPQ